MLATVLKRSTIAVILGLVACKDPTTTVSTVKDDEASPAPAPAPASTEGDGCDVNAMRTRSKATFDRTTDCAADAVSAGFANKVKLAGSAVKDTKQIVDTIKRVAAKVGANVTNVSTARAILCVRALSDYVTTETVKNLINDSAAGLSAEDKAELEKKVLENLAQTFSGGTTDTFKKFGEAVDKPGAESLVAFISALVSNVGDVGQMVTVCGAVAAEFGEVALPALSSYSNAFGNLGTIGSIAKCSYAVIGNSLDVGKELSCLGKDLERLAEQYAALQRANGARCEEFKDIVELPGMQAVLQGGGEKATRDAACYGVIHRWGSCLYTTGAHSCDQCKRLCTGYVNAAGSNAGLQPIIDRAAAATGVGDGKVVTRLVFTANNYCSVQLADGIRPCVNFCMGQVSDPSCSVP